MTSSNIALVILILAILIGLGHLVYLFITAPMGYEDSEGFHRDESKNKNKHN